jgi:hypothetical protein
VRQDPPVGGGTGTSPLVTDRITSAWADLHTFPIQSVRTRSVSPTRRSGIQSHQGLWPRSVAGVPYGWRNARQLVGCDAGPCR